MFGVEKSRGGRQEMTRRGFLGSVAGGAAAVGAALATLGCEVSNPGDVCVDQPESARCPSKENPNSVMVIIREAIEGAIISGDLFKLAGNGVKDRLFTNDMRGAIKRVCDIGDLRDAEVVVSGVNPDGTVKDRGGVVFSLGFVDSPGNGKVVRLTLDYLYSNSTPDGMYQVSGNYRLFVDENGDVAVTADFEKTDGSVVTIQDVDALEQIGFNVARYFGPGLEMPVPDEDPESEETMEV